jgi:radical SAM superfamily enzyme with C-terminal helix-hairpin-helix motif
MSRYLILDCFVDEPACFGVPPFVSPYPRYLFGALIDAGHSEQDIDYCTIDKIRSASFAIADENYDKVFLIGGAVVPGKYLGEKIGRYDEIVRIVQANPRCEIVIGGLAGRLIAQHDFRNVTALSGDIEQFAFSGMKKDELRSYGDLDRWAVIGAQMVKRHPDFPHLVAEMESYRGCPRKSHCSFCSESVYDSIAMRSVHGIISEVDALIAQGISRFRIGRQADILAYGTRFGEYRDGYPRPEPSAVEELFSELRARRDDGRITTLNIDNANPGTIARYPAESGRIIHAIAQSITPGDTMPLGIESFDPKVVAANNLKVNRDEAISVVRLINEIGGARVDGIPVLLPGINLIHGLAGESAESFRTNYEALLAIRDQNLLVKRINIRSLLPFPGTDAAQTRPRTDKRIENRYEFYRDKIREDIDRVMLERIYPVGTIIRDVRVVEHRFEFSLARPLQSYAITMKIPRPLDIGSFFDMAVIAHRERSIIALPVPIQINQLSGKALEYIPGIGKRTAGEIVLRRPLSSVGDLLVIAPSVSGEILKHLTF